MQVNDVEILSRPGDIRMFEKNIVWQDLVRVLRNEKEISAQEFDSVDPEDRLEIVRIQMRRQMIDFLIELPSLLAEQLGAEEEMT